MKEKNNYKETKKQKEEINEVNFLNEEKQELLRLMKSAREQGKYSDYKMHIKNLQEINSTLEKQEQIYNQNLYNLNKDQLITLIDYYSKNGYSIVANTEISNQGVFMKNNPIIVNNIVEGIKPDYMITGNMEFEKNTKFTKIITEDEWKLKDIDNEGFKRYSVVVMKSEYVIDNVTIAYMLTPNGTSTTVEVVYKDDYIEFISSEKGDAKIIIT